MDGRAYQQSESVVDVGPVEQILGDGVRSSHDVVLLGGVSKGKMMLGLKVSSRLG